MVSSPAQALELASPPVGTQSPVPVQADAMHTAPPLTATEPVRQLPPEPFSGMAFMSWPRRACTKDPYGPTRSAEAAPPGETSESLALEAASELLLFRSELRMVSERPDGDPVAMAAAAATADAGPSYEKPTLTPMRLLMVVLLNLVDCINMNILTPYAADMVADLLGKPGQVDDPEVLRNVGLLIGVYNVSEMIFSPLWGRFSDRVGRRPVILLSLGGAMLVPLAFGLAQSMTMAMAIRAFNGVLCGSIGITKTYVAELVEKKNEARAFSILTTVYSAGMILGPVMGGMLVSPAKWSPAMDEFLSHGVFRIFKANPFFLPNLVFSLLAITVWVLAICFLKESLPPPERKALQQARAAARELKLEARRAAMSEEGAARRGGLAKARDCILTQLPFFGYPAKLLRAMASYGLAVGYVISTVQNIILLYQIPVAAGGFGLGPERLGMLQNFAALGLLTTQLCLYPKLVELKGYRWCVAAGLTGVLIVTMPMPLYGLLHDPAKFGAWRLVPVVVMMVVQQASFGFCTPTTTVWINRFADGMDRGEVNGWANSFAALCRAIAPMCVGFLQGLGNSMGWRGGQYLALYVISLLAIAISVLLLPILPKHVARAQVEDQQQEADIVDREDNESSVEGDSRV